MMVLFFSTRNTSYYLWIFSYQCSIIKVIEMCQVKSGICGNLFVMFSIKFHVKWWTMVIFKVWPSAPLVTRVIKHIIWIVLKNMTLRFPSLPGSLMQCLLKINFCGGLSGKMWHSNLLYGCTMHSLLNLIIPSWMLESIWTNYEDLMICVH